ncbi:MAG TPA: ArdC-like ssDNA-binding domain-containing protein [Trueperaceae bacterium]|nr:ArdC-like ssDNA-binding domain-containing protein [Trueperaceae bacterium]
MTTRQDSKQAALDILHKGVTDLMTSDGWKRALQFRQRFHNYSYMNTLLILGQRPDATLVAGYRTWQTSNRYVRKGEKGIAILAPLLVRDPDDHDQLNLVGFKTVYVFDLSQTEGEPIPQRDSPRLLLDTPEAKVRLAGLHFRLAMFCASQGVRVSWDFQHEHALGVYRPADKRIAIRPGLSHTQAFKTLCHEAAHMLLHTGGGSRHSAELEAETAAFLVSHAIGIDTSSYSFAYLASWTDSLEDLIQAGDRASKAADQILEQLTADPDAASTEPKAKPTTDSSSSSGQASKRPPLIFVSS